MKTKDERCEVPIAAMIDIVFLLLVYFIVTSTEVIDEVFVQVNLPGRVVPGDSDVSLDIYVLDNTYKVSGKSYSISEIEKYITNVAGSTKDISVNMKVSEKASHEKLVTLLDLLNKVKLSKFSLHTLK